MDSIEWILLGTNVAVLGLVALLLLGIRAFARSFGPILAQMHDLRAFVSKLMTNFIWEDAEEVDKDGTKRIVRRPSKEFMAQIEAVVPAVAPVLMKAGMEWAKNNVKIGNLMGAGGPGGVDLAGALGNAGIGKALGLKGGLAKLADTFAPGLIQRFLPSLLGGGGPAKASEAGASTNPFLKA